MSSYNSSVHSYVIEDISYIKFLDKYKYLILFHFLKVYFSIMLMELSSIIKIISYILEDIKCLEIFMEKSLMIEFYFLKNSIFLLKAKLYLRVISD